MSELDTKPDNGRQYRRMTVANIREGAAEDFVHVVFLESARFYRLEKHNEQFAETLAVLRRALSEDGIVWVGFDSPEGEVILGAQQR